MTDEMHVTMTGELLFETKEGWWVVTWESNCDCCAPTEVARIRRTMVPGDAEAQVFFEAVGRLFEAKLKGFMPEDGEVLMVERPPRHKEPH